MKTTPTLGLKLYDGTDAPDLVAGYNASMEAIDKASAEWGTSDIPANIVTQIGGQLFSPEGTALATVGLSANTPSRERNDGVAMSIVDLPNIVFQSATGTTNLTHGSEAFSLRTESPDITLTTSGGSITWAQLKAALAALETLKTQIGELQTQIDSKVDTSTVTALTTRVSTAEGEIDTLQTTVAAATAAGTTQLTVSELAAAKTNAKNLVTA